MRAPTGGLILSTPLRTRPCHVVHDGSGSRMPEVTRRSFSPQPGRCLRQVGRWVVLGAAWGMLGEVCVDNSVDT